MIIQHIAIFFRNIQSRHQRKLPKPEGIQKGIEKGVEKTAIRLLTKKFGVLAEDMRIKIEQLDAETLDIIVDEMLDYDSLEDVPNSLGG